MQFIKHLAAKNIRACCSLGRSLHRSIIIACACFSIVACENFDPQPVNFTQSDIITIGDVHTLEIDGRVLSSLPQNKMLVNDERVELGKMLFWDPLLSGDRDVACATCHLPDHGYSDGNAQSIGVGGVGKATERQVGHTGFVRRNSQGLINVGWNGIGETGLFDLEQAPMFWDNRVTSLALQALEPIRDLQEMRGENFTREQIEQEVVFRLNANDEYRSLFTAAFDDDSITFENVGLALAEFQKTLTANNSAYDRWMRGEVDAMSSDELSAMQEFVTSGCADCHSGPMFSDFELHVLGAADHDTLEEPDEGDGSFAFRTPTLRQLDFTGPYFHNGQFNTLAAAIDFYDDAEDSRNPNVADSALDSELSDIPEMDDGRGAFIQSFLNTLNDPSFDRSVPEAVPSGLPPGGL